MEKEVINNLEQELKKEGKTYSGLNATRIGIIVLSLILIGVGVFTLISNSSNTVTIGSDENEISLDVNALLANISNPDNPAVAIVIEDFGTIAIELFPEYAPVTVSNFINLTEDGFYDGLTFHRIIENFMMQGGDPAGNGSGGSDEMIIGEFSANNIDNPLRHERGVVSMARLGNDFDSASSQFFIVVADSFFLDSLYAAFGNVIYGMDTVDAILEASNALDSNGTILFADQPVIQVMGVIN